MTTSHSDDEVPDVFDGAPPTRLQWAIGALRGAVAACLEAWRIIWPLNQDRSDS